VTNEGPPADEQEVIDRISEALADLDELAAQSQELREASEGNEPLDLFFLKEDEDSDKDSESGQDEDKPSDKTT
jgi:hypothetical protein